MTKRWIMDAQSRRKKAYLEIHRKLRDECFPKPEPSKSERKRQASMMFRQQADK